MTRAMAAVLGLMLAAESGRAGVLTVPVEYAPEKSWPVVVSFQDNPSEELMAKTKYILIHSGGKGMEATANAVKNLKLAAERYNIDPLRIYGTGFSRGGQECLEQTWMHPDWFAAIAPVCNDLREKPDRPGKVLLVKYITTPTLLLHGTHDSFLETGTTLLGHMKQAKCPVDFRTYEGGHSPELPFKKDVTMLTDFFDKHVLDPYPKQVVHVVVHPQATRAFWVDAALLKKPAATQPAASPATAPAAASAPAGATVDGVFKVTVKGPNQIDVEANEHIARLELYLTDKLVDMNKPVTVMAGARKLFEGPASARLAVKINDGEEMPHTPQRPLWEELAAVKAKAKYARVGAATASAPAK